MRKIGLPLDKYEISKLRMLICDHDNAVAPQNEFSCSCCGNIDKLCPDCGKHLVHECCDHDTDDGYCGSCR